MDKKELTEVLVNVQEIQKQKTIENNVAGCKKIAPFSCGCLVVLFVLIGIGVLTCGTSNNKPLTAEEIQYVGTWKSSVDTQYGKIDTYMLLSNSNSRTISMAAEGLRKRSDTHWESSNGGINIVKTADNTSAGFMKLYTDNNGVIYLYNDKITFIKVSNDHLILWKVGENSYTDPNKPYSNAYGL